MDRQTVGPPYGGTLMFSPRGLDYPKK